MITFKQFLAEQAMAANDGTVHFDWIQNSADDTKTKVLALMQLLPDKPGNRQHMASMMKEFLKTQEAREADIIKVTAKPADVEFFKSFGFKETGTPHELQLVKTGAVPVPTF